MPVVSGLDAEAAEWQARARRFVEEELYPVERRIAERGAIDAEEVRELRARAREAGFSHYNLPRELGCADLPLLAQVAIEEQAGRATLRSHEGLSGNLTRPVNFRVVRHPTIVGTSGRI